MAHRPYSHGTQLYHGREDFDEVSCVAEVKFLTWTGDNLLRQVVYEGLREDKPATEERRPVSHR